MPPEHLFGMHLDLVRLKIVAEKPAALAGNQSRVHKFLIGLRTAAGATWPLFLSTD